MSVHKISRENEHLVIEKVYDSEISTSLRLRTISCVRLIFITLYL